MVGRLKKNIEKTVFALAGGGCDSIAVAEDGSDFLNFLGNGRLAQKREKKE